MQMINRRASLRGWLLAAFILSAWVGMVEGAPTINLRGRVLDESGAVVPTALVAVYYPSEIGRAHV